MLHSFPLLLAYTGNRRGVGGGEQGDSDQQENDQPVKRGL